MHNPLFLRIAQRFNDNVCKRSIAIRARRMEQRSIIDSAYADHDTGRALAAIADLLDEHPEFLDRIARDLDRGGPSPRGRARSFCAAGS